ncbi:hydroxyacid dehydrogenase [Patescibacteria group bacterium]|nr:hydroxyacid dehydrogenase [Patescibacteria group bacterium]
MKIAFFELKDWEEEIVKQKFSEDDLFFSKEKLESFNIPSQKDFDIISVFVGSVLDKEMLSNFPNLKFVATRSTGFDHIDLAYCKKKGIKVGYVPGYGVNTVAEYAFGLILNLTRKIYQSIDQIKEHGDFSLEGLQGVDIKGKTLGIIGTGRIGKESIKIANGFGMNIIAYDLHPNETHAVEQNYKYVSLEDLLKNSDIITIHAPYTKETHYLINEDNFQLIKKGAFLVNTARGAIVQTEALIVALKSGNLAGYATDVLEDEGEVKDELNYLTKTRLKDDVIKNMLYNHILMEMPNVLITPHNAFNSIEALQRILNTTMENIKGFQSDGQFAEVKS